jgi:hypothetical protein
MQGSLEALEIKFTKKAYSPSDFQEIDGAHPRYKLVWYDERPSIFRLNSQNEYAVYNGFPLPIATRDTVEKAKQCLHDLATGLKTSEYHTRHKRSGSGGVKRNVAFTIYKDDQEMTFKNLSECGAFLGSHTSTVCQLKHGNIIQLKGWKFKGVQPQA